MGARASTESTPRSQRRRREVTDMSETNGYADGRKKRMASARSNDKNDTKRVSIYIV